jgi:GNAT superfamily N-acetyltransferase
MHVADFSIRLAVANDVAAINAVFRRSSLSNEGDREFLLDNPEVLVFDDAAIRAGRTRVAVADVHIVGFATTTVLGEKAELDDLFVDPPWMRRGVARALILEAVLAARAVGSRRIEVTANEHARSFYDAVGFVADGAVATQFGPGTRMHLDIAP